MNVESAQHGDDRDDGDGDDRGSVGFGDRLADAIARIGPLCVGIDPSAALLSRWGLTDDADGVRRFSDGCLAALSGVVPVVKPQVAFFERHGSAGIAALETLIVDARSEGFLVIADAKRGDIGSTSAAYAEAWLDPSRPLACDAVTATPYLGLGALQPMIDMARRYGRAVIVVVRSSNPEGRSLQEARLTRGILSPDETGETDESGETVEDGLLAAIASLNGEERRAGARFGSIGAVVGATLAASRFPLALGGPVLAPGLGAQGADMSDLATLFKGTPAGSVLPSLSRGVLDAGPSAARLRATAERFRDGAAAALA